MRPPRRAGVSFFSNRSTHALLPARSGPSQQSAIQFIHLMRERGAQARSGRMNGFVMPDRCERHTNPDETLGELLLPELEAHCYGDQLSLRDRARYSGQSAFKFKWRARGEQCALRREPERAARAAPEHFYSVRDGRSRILHRIACSAEAAKSAKEAISVQLLPFHDCVTLSVEQVVRQDERDDSIPPRAVIDECDRRPVTFGPGCADDRIGVADIDVREGALYQSTAVSDVDSLQ